MKMEKLFYLSHHRDFDDVRKKSNNRIGMGLFGNLLNSIKKKDPATDIESFYFIGK